MVQSILGQAIITERLKLDVKGAPEIAGAHPPNSN